MEYKEALTILLNLSAKDVLTSEEREAVNKAIGMFSWADLSKSTIRSIKKRKEEDAQW
jgi:hypothetical protein